LRAFGNVFQIGTESIPVGSNITFGSNGPLFNLTHTLGTAPIVVGLAGIYNIAFEINTSNNNPQDWAIQVNGVNRAEFNAAGQSITGLATLALNAGDAVTINNIATVPDPAVLRTTNTISASIYFNKVDA
jgi:hypothetical protein